MCFAGNQGSTFSPDERGYARNVEAWLTFCRETFYSHLECLLKNGSLTRANHEAAQADAGGA